VLPQKNIPTRRCKIRRTNVWLPGKLGNAKLICIPQRLDGGCIEEEKKSTCEEVGFFLEEELAAVSCEWLEWGAEIEVAFAALQVVYLL
jgi:hypothetical protein